MTRTGMQALLARQERDASLSPAHLACAPMNSEEAPPTISSVAPPSHDPYAAFRFASFNLYMTGNFLAFVGRQMLAVAVEWEIYRRTHSATALGLVGLVLVIPVVCLSLPA